MDEEKRMDESVEVKDAPAAAMEAGTSAAAMEPGMAATEPETAAAGPGASAAGPETAAETVTGAGRVPVAGIETAAETVTGADRVSAAEAVSGNAAATGEARMEPPALTPRQQRKQEKANAKAEKERIAREEKEEKERAAREAKAEKERLRQEEKQEKKSRKAIVRQERRKELGTLVHTAEFVMLVAFILLAIDQVGVYGFLFVWLFIALMAASVAVLLVGIFCAIRKKRCGILFVAAVVGILLCTAWFIFLVSSQGLGLGPVPN